MRQATTRRTFRHAAARCIAVLLLSVVPAGCAARDPTGVRLQPADPALARVSGALLEIEFAGFPYAGTAIPISPEHLLTCRHVLPDGAQTGSVLLKARLNEAPVTLSVEAIGREASIDGDWAVLRVASAHGGLPPPIELDLTRDLAMGRMLLLAGYWEGGPAPEPGARASVGLTYVDARIRRPPLPWLSVPSGVICVDAGDRDVYEGLSGGPALLWDDQRGRWVAIGIYRGMRKWRFLGLETGVHTVVRVRQDVLERLDRRPGDRSSARPVTSRRTGAAAGR